MPKATRNDTTTAGTAPAVAKVATPKARRIRPANLVAMAGARTGTPAVAQAEEPRAGAKLSPDCPAHDADLLALCKQFDRQYKAVEAFPDFDTVALQEEFEQLLEARWATQDALERIEPKTLAGMIAKVYVAIALLAEIRGEDPGEQDTSFAMTTLCDMTWLDGGTVT